MSIKNISLIIMLILFNCRGKLENKLSIKYIHIKMIMYISECVFQNKNKNQINILA